MQPSEYIIFYIGEGSLPEAFRIPLATLNIGTIWVTHEHGNRGANFDLVGHFPSPSTK